MKKICSLLFFSLLILSSLEINSFAATTLTGSTGLIRMPSADCLKPKSWDAALDYSFDNASASSMTSISDLSGIWSYKVNIGADMGTNSAMELGFVGRTEKTTAAIKEGVFINLKFCLGDQNSSGDLKMALGIENLTSSSESDVYMVATKYFKSGLGLHFGAMFDFPNGKFRPLGMLGTNIPVGGNNLDILGEVFAGESVFQVDAGVRYAVSDSVALQVNAINVTNNSSAKEAQAYSAGICLTDLF